jgi:hypothetical protein
MCVRNVLIPVLIKQTIMRCSSDNEEATTATIGCVHDRSDDDYSEEETYWEAENKESARRFSCDNQLMVKVHRELQELEKVKAQRAANIKNEEAKKSELRWKMLSKLLNEKYIAAAYMSSTVLGFLLTWQEVTRYEKAIEAKLAQEFVHKEFSRIFY